MIGKTEPRALESRAARRPHMVLSLFAFTWLVVAALAVLLVS